MKRVTMQARGFTLVELLVAITVLAIVAVLGWRGLDGIVRSREQLTSEMEQTRGIQLAFAQLQSDLEQVADQADLLNGHQNLVADNTRLVFIRTVLAENAPTQLQVVSYRIRDGVLTRRESPYTRDLLQLDALWQAGLSDTGDVQREVALHKGVNGMAVRIWENGVWRTPDGSASSSATSAASSGTDANAGTAAPTGATGLEVSLQIQGMPNALAKVFLLGAV
jgi:general secretion pathway protein J